MSKDKKYHSKAWYKARVEDLEWKLEMRSKKVEELSVEVERVRELARTAQKEQSSTQAQAKALDNKLEQIRKIVEPQAFLSIKTTTGGWGTGSSGSIYNPNSLTTYPNGA